MVPDGDEIISFFEIPLMVLNEVFMGTPKRNGMEFDCQRNGMRFDFEHECILDHKGFRYSCQIKNISISGALVCAKDFPPGHLQLGDTCALLLCTDPTVIHGEYTSRVTRLEPSKIGLFFLGMAF